MFDFHARVPREELDRRLAALRARLTAADPAWKLALVNSKINMYYLAGTMQEGVLTITPDETILWVRRSFDRAVGESNLPDIRPMRSYRTLGEYFTEAPASVFVEAKTATLEWLGMVRKYLSFEAWKPPSARARAHTRPTACARPAGCMPRFWKRSCLRVCARA